MIGSVAICYNEQRFIKPHLKHLPDWIDEKLVLVSTVPWQGDYELPDDTDLIARDLGAEVIYFNWRSEEDQRNAGQEWHHDKDWIIILDPDEFLDRKGWKQLKETLKTTTADALVVDHQRVFWKNKEVYPHTDYQQIIAVRPNVRFIDKRVVGSPYKTAPVELYHFSWARTDKECLSKITHYAHANELIPDWYKNVWLAGKTTNLHPHTPETLKALIEPKLPKELEALKLWPGPTRK